MNIVLVFVLAWLANGDVAYKTFPDPSGSLASCKSVQAAYEKKLMDSGDYRDVHVFCIEQKLVKKTAI